MKKKFVFSIALGLPLFAVGGLWFYQGMLFEKEMNREVTQTKAFLKTIGVSFDYDEFKVSKFQFKAHLVNPHITGEISKVPEIQQLLKQQEGFESLADLSGSLSIKGEVSASFSLLANTVSFTTQGDWEMKFQGPVEFEFTAPRDHSIISIKRRNYDFFGKYPFLSMSNIQEISANSKGISAFLNREKLFDIKDNFSNVSLDVKGKGADVTLTSHTNGFQFFKITNAVKVNAPALEKWNPLMVQAFNRLAIMGPQDQKISLSFHLDDYETYIESLKELKDKSVNKDGARDVPGTFGKLLPEGLRIDLKDYSFTNSVDKGFMKLNIARSKDSFAIKGSGDIKLLDQWPAYWQSYFENLIETIKLDTSPEMSQQEKQKVVALMGCFAKEGNPQLQHFGNIIYSIDLEIPVKWPLTQGKGAVDLKCDLYDIGIVGSVNDGGISVKVKTKNSSAMMGDLESYANRVAKPLNSMYQEEIKNILGSLKGAQAVLEKVLEPSGASEQSVDIIMNQEGFKVGQYDLVQIMALFGQAMAPSPESSSQAGTQPPAQSAVQGAS